MRETSENLPKPSKKSSPGTKNQNPRENFHLTMGPLLKIAKMCLQTRHLLCLQPRHLLCQQTRHLLCQQTSPKTSPRRSPDRGGRFAAAPVWRMWGGCLGRCLLTQQMSCLLTQQMSWLQTQQMSCLQTHLCNLARRLRCVVLHPKPNISELILGFLTLLGCLVSKTQYFGINFGILDPFGVSGVQNPIFRN